MLCKPPDNHKENTCRRYTKGKGKGIKAYHYKKKINETNKKDSKRRRGKSRDIRQTKKINKVEKVSDPLWIITFNTNRLNSSIKRCRVAEWIKEQAKHILSIRDSL